jgi:hypothetical protein
VAVATGDAGVQFLVYVFRVVEQRDSVTIVGFDRKTGHVGLVEGPLPITDQTQNITTVP